MFKNILKSPLINVLLFSIFWAVEIFVAKIAFLEGAQIMQFSIQSFLIALIILSIYVIPVKFKQFSKISLRTYKWLIFANAILLGVGGFLGNAGIQLTSAINAAFLTQFSTVATTIFAWLILREKITKAKILSIIIILLGTFFLVTEGQLIAPHLGDIFIILACLAWSFGPVLIKKMIKTAFVDPDIATLLRPASGIPFLLLIILFSPFYSPSFQEVFRVNIFEINLPFYVILNGVFLALTWIFVNRTLKVASASYTALLGSLTPILVAILALSFLNEKISIVQFIGILMIISANFIIHRKKMDKH